MNINKPVHPLLKFFQTYWWAGFVLFIGIFSFGVQQNYREILDARIYLCIFALSGGFFIEWFSSPNLRLLDIVKIPKWLLHHPIIIAIIAYAFWIFLAAFFTPDPIITLTGNVIDGEGSGLVKILYCFIAINIYIRIIKNNAIRIQMYFALSGIILVVLGIIESLLGIYIFIPLEDDFFPLTFYPQQGHYAVILSLFLGIFVYFSVFIKNKFKFIFQISTLLMYFVLGLTLTRTVWFVVFLFLIFMFIKKEFFLAFFAIVFITFGWMASTYRGVEKGVKPTDTSTLETRKIMQKSGFFASLDRPIFGFGNEYSKNWTKYVSREEVKRFIKMEFQEDYVKNIEDIFFYKKGEKKLAMSRLYSFSTHNEYLEIALFSGLPALFLYLIIVFLILKSTILTPIGFGLVSIHTMFFLWHLSEPAQPVLWVALGIGAAQCKLMKNKTISSI